MNKSSLLTVSTLIACGALLIPGAARAKTSGANGAGSGEVSAAAESMAAQMVPAQAVLDKDLDARKTQPGQEFRATLTSTIHLKNGTELPRGTALVGTVATDKMESGGGSTLALKFTQAELKNGKTIPIEATIVGISPPSDSSAWDGSDAQAPPDPWNGSALQVDDIGVMSGVDLHSKIADEDSGVFVANKKEDVKFSARSQLSLAIGAQSGTGMNGGF
jgi:hypothetical protein